MIEIENIDMTGSIVSYAVADDVASIALQSRGGDVLMYDGADGEKYWTIKENTKEALTSRDLSGRKLYFNGTAGVVLEIRIVSGLMA